MQMNGRAIQCVSEEIKNNGNIVLAAVQQYNYALEYAFEKMQNNENVVIVAVQQSGFALTNNAGLI